MSRQFSAELGEDSNLYFRFGETKVPKGWDLSKAAGIAKHPRDMTEKDHQQYRYWVKWRTEAISKK